MRILIYGAGRRVLQDILPTLLCLYPDAQYSIVARRPRIIYCRGVKFTVESSVNPVHYQVVYVGVSAASFEDILNVMDFSYDRLLVDTPVISEVIAKKLEASKASVMEDSAFLLSELDMIPRKRFNFSCFYKSFYFYHGVALAREACGNFIFHHCRSSWGIIIGTHGILIFVGKRNYDEGWVSFNFRNKKIRSLSINEEELIGGWGTLDNFSNRFLQLKRIVLKQLLSGERHYSPMMAHDDFRISRK